MNKKPIKATVFRLGHLCEFSEGRYMLIHDLFLNVFRLLMNKNIDSLGLQKDLTIHLTFLS